MLLRYEGNKVVPHLTQEEKEDLVTKLVYRAMAQYGQISPCAKCKGDFKKALTIETTTSGAVAFLWFNIENHSTKTVTERIC